MIVGVKKIAMQQLQGSMNTLVKKPHPPSCFFNS